jgi:hypothetical protein
MPDISKCNGTNYPQKHTCYRYTALDSMRQAYVNFDSNLEKGKPCGYYYDNTGRATNGSVEKH